ncbi:hypothetical protein RISK_000790 [Rhodopirellula islandica]|uniref:Uncharacterized protein n=1 Tax=Rhodopirellula islandica TaxID=595434 RepID=A0A0J1ENA4_RHOIS|nr:hypothetical protein RISK_000790 [Rhodopirellula islandica]
MSRAGLAAGFVSWAGRLTSGVSGGDAAPFAEEDSVADDMPRSLKMQ